MTLRLAHRDRENINLDLDSNESHEISSLLGSVAWLLWNYHDRTGSSWRKMLSDAARNWSFPHLKGQSFNDESSYCGHENADKTERRLNSCLLKVATTQKRWVYTSIGLKDLEKYHANRSIISYAQYDVLSLSGEQFFLKDKFLKKNDLCSTLS